MRQRPASALRGVVFLGTALFAVLLSSQAPPPAAAGRPATIPQAVRANAARTGRARVIVQLRHDAGAARLLARLPRNSFRPVRQFHALPYLALELTPEGIDGIAALDDDVAQVWEDRIVRPTLADSVPLIQADQTWTAGYDGSGTAIAILDTGVDATHPFFAGKIEAEACFSGGGVGISQSFCPNGQTEQIGIGAATPCLLDGCLHGTHVAGIAAGDDITSTEPPGVARGAHVIPVQVFSEITDAESCGGTAPCLGGFTSDVIAGLEYVYTLALNGTYDVAAVNMSLGENIFEQACDSEPYKPAIDNLRAIGIATVVAAGNDGWPFGLSSPACVSSAVSVGATTKQDDVAWFSNVAPFLKLFAPGDAIRSSVPGGGYESLSGTSMAAPHVAGIWGILKQALPDATVDTLLTTLQNTGLPIEDNRYDTIFGPGSTIPRVRLFEALSTLVAIDNPVPTIASLTPPGWRAGFGAFTLTVSGSGFTTRSVVEWNGSARSTTLLNSGQLRTSITAADVAAAGTADVRVTTPPPGGGTTDTLTFTIAPPPVLTASASIVAPGETDTVTLSAGAGGSTDWLALAGVGAPDNSYLQWVYVGAGITSRAWAVTMPTAAGSYEFRLFVNNIRVASSPAVTVDPAYNPTPIASSVSPNRVMATGAAFTLTVTGSKFANSSVVRWNGSARATTFVSATQLRATIDATDISTVGTAQVTVFTPAPGGGSSSGIAVTIYPPPAITLNTATSTTGSKVTATLTNSPGGQYDWLALASSTAANTSYITWVYVGAGVTTRTWTVTMPATPGTYEIRLFLNNGYTRAAISPPITVTQAPKPTPTLTVSTTTAAVSTPVTVTLTGGAGGASDWLALAATSAPNTTYITWVYVGAGVTTRTWTATMPATPGTYEFRLFLNNGYTRAATSPTVTVSQ